MDIKEYINEGYIEYYVLGLGTEQERARFELLCAQYPELLQARLAFENTLEQQARSNSLPVPENLKEKIFSAIHNPANQAKVIPINTTEKKPAPDITWLKFFAAASIILLAGSIYWIIALYKENMQLVAKAAPAKQQRQKHIPDQPVIGYQKMISLDGTRNAPGSFAVAYFDTVTKAAYFCIHGLPAPAANMQYQLWAITKGQPVNLGLFEMQQDHLKVLMKNLPVAEAFVITLEKEGGTPAPTMDAAYATAKL